MKDVPDQQRRQERPDYFLLKSGIPTEMRAHCWQDEKVDKAKQGADIGELDYCDEGGRR